MTGERMMIRLSPDDKVWVAEQAADEGVEPHIFVRLLINRVRRGRPLLLANVEQQMATPMPQVANIQHQSPDLDDLIEARLNEDVDIPEDTVPVQATAAIPLRRVERVKYNPGRTGTGG